MNKKTPQPEQPRSRHLRDLTKGNMNEGEPTIPRYRVPPPPAPRRHRKDADENTSGDMQVRSTRSVSFVASDEQKRFEEQKAALEERTARLRQLSLSVRSNGLSENSRCFTTFPHSWGGSDIIYIVEDDKHTNPTKSSRPDDYTYHEL